MDLLMKKLIKLLKLRNNNASLVVDIGLLNIAYFLREFNNRLLDFMKSGIRNVSPPKKMEFIMH